MNFQFSIFNFQIIFNFQKLFVSIFVVGLLFFPLVSRADGSYQVNLFQDGNGDGRWETGEASSTEMICYQGLVPCGKPVLLKGEYDPITGHCKDGVGIPMEIPCTFCHFPVMLLGTINFLILPPTGIVFIIAVLLLAAGGALFVFSAGRPGLASQGRRIMTATIIGLVIIYAGWLIVNEFLTFIGVSQNFEALQPNKWNQVMFNCPINVPKP